MIKRISKYVIVFIIMLIIFLTLMVGACFIPNSAIYKNVKTSSEQLYELGEKQIIKLSKKEIVMFYFTDILMLNISYSVDSTEPFESAILARKNYNKDITSNIEQMGENVEADSNYMGIYNGTAIELNDLIDNKVDESFEYARYWHGYLIFLRPMLVLFNYSQIICIFKCITLILIIILSVMLLKKFNLLVMNSFILSIIFTDMLYSTNCLNENLCFIISLIASIYILKKGNSIKHSGLVFFIIGIVTNFLDLLTCPILTLGYPLIFYYLVQKEIYLKQSIKQLFLISMFWGIGYITCWITKWIIADMFYDKGIIINAIYQIVYRTSGQDITLIQLIYNLKKYLGYVYYIILGILFIFLILSLIKLNKNKIMYFFIAFIPILWLIVLKNHSTVHAFFTYKILSVTICSIFIGISEILDKSIKKNKNDTKVLNN